MIALGCGKLFMIDRVIDSRYKGTRLTEEESCMRHLPFALVRLCGMVAFLNGQGCYSLIREATASVSKYVALVYHPARIVSFHSTSFEG
jgi:hypothetical protein